MWQEDAPLVLSYLYIKCTSAEFCDSLSAYLILTSCLWQDFSTPARWDCLVYSATSPFKRNLNFPPARPLFIHSLLMCHFFFFVLMRRGSVFFRLLVWLCVSVCVSQLARAVLVFCRTPLIIWDPSFSPACSTGRCHLCACVCQCMCVFQWDSPCMNHPDSISSLLQNFLSCFQGSNWTEMH